MTSPPPRKGWRLARKLGIREYWYESLMTDGYMKSLKALYELKQIVKNGLDRRDSKKDEAKQYFEMYVSRPRAGQRRAPQVGGKC